LHLMRPAAFGLVPLPVLAYIARAARTVENCGGWSLSPPSHPPTYLLVLGFRRGTLRPLAGEALPRLSALDHDPHDLRQMGQEEGRKCGFELTNVEKTKKEDVRQVQALQAGHSSADSTSSLHTAGACHRWMLATQGRRCWPTLARRCLRLRGRMLIQGSLHFYPFRISLNAAAIASRERHLPKLTKLKIALYWYRK